jgi:hypothetical protein
MTLAVSAPVIRIYEASALAFPTHVVIPPGRSVPEPPCLACGSYATSPPPRNIWTSVNGARALSVICQDCGADCTDAELEAKILASACASARGARTTRPATPRLG